MATKTSPDRKILIPDVVPDTESAKDWTADPGGRAVPDRKRIDSVSLLRAGTTELGSLTRLKDFPEFFVRLARRTGLRLVLLKRWTSGLQVILEENIQMPAESRQKRSDGRAPIPSTKADIFEAIVDDGAVYSGPVPVRHFPLDLTLMLGRGSRDRQIVILPLPAANHWNTFLYMDADQSTGKSLAVAEILAQFALARMCLLNKGQRARSGKVAGILKAELYRRQQQQARRVASGQVSADDDSAPAETIEPVDPFLTEAVESQDSRGAEAEGLPLAPPDARPPDPAPRKSRKKEVETAEALPDLPDWDPDSGQTLNLTPEVILKHSGELPALPKAACHIMAVIEDPRTTATKLEKALAMDQTLTAKVLRIANSPFYGAVREISTVSEAIVRLGFITIRNWTLVTAARSVFLAPGAGMLYQKIWKQSVLSAMSGQLVAQSVGGCEPESVFIGGLMQNIGQLVLARSNPELFQDILVRSQTENLAYHEIERQILGFDHGELGSLLIQEWNLSQELEEAVRWHHRFEDPEARNTRTAAMIALGEEIALCTSAEDESPDDPGADPSDDHEAPEPLSDAARFLGVTRSRLNEMKERADQLQIDPHFFN